MSYDIERWKVKLRKAGWSNQDVDILMEGITNVNQVVGIQKRLDLMGDICTRTYGLTTMQADAKILIGELLTLLLAHENDGLQAFTVSCRKHYGKWHFTLSED